jgi:hypothetical protein
LLSQISGKQYIQVIHLCILWHRSLFLQLLGHFLLEQLKMVALRAVSMVMPKQYLSLPLLFFLFLLLFDINLVHVFLASAAVNLLVLDLYVEEADLLVVSQDLLLSLQHILARGAHQKVESALLHLDTGVLHPGLE